MEFVRDLPLRDENGLPERGKAKDVYGQKQGSIELNTMAIVSTRLFFKS